MISTLDFISLILKLPYNAQWSVIDQSVVPPNQGPQWPVIAQSLDKDHLEAPRGLTGQGDKALVDAG